MRTETKGNDEAPFPNQLGRVPCREHQRKGYTCLYRSAQVIEAQMVGLMRIRCVKLVRESGMVLFLNFSCVNLIWRE